MGDNTANHTESRREDWGTPQDMFDKLDSIFNFKFDLCADPTNSKTGFFITEKMDLMSPQAFIAVHSLTNMSDYLWINPPYKPHGGTGKYVGRAVEIAGPRGIVALVPASVGSLWWQQNLWAHFDAFIFPRRFPFEGAGNKAKFDCAICVKWATGQAKLVNKLNFLNLGELMVKP